MMLQMHHVILVLATVLATGGAGIAQKPLEADAGDEAALQPA